MRRIRSLTLAAILVTSAATSTSAAAPEDPGVALPETRVIAVVPASYALDTDIVVRDWVLCTTASAAKILVEARQVGVAAALEAYNNLKIAKSCGQFEELRVILRAQLYAATLDALGEARAFAAKVDLSGSWASAFVISGSLPEED
jgi:hypothetical protein